MIGLPARYWAKVDRTDHCWTWTACINSRGYGCFAVNGKAQLVHRLSYADAFGDIPDGLTIDHLCRNIRCVRPDHLEPVTLAENIRRAADTKTACRRGHTLTFRPGDRQRRCRTCENDRRRELAAA